MQFNSYLFIFVFLPAVFVLYFLANKIQQQYGKLVLIFASMVFYAYAGKISCIFLIVSIAVNYLFVMLIKRKIWKKVFLWLPVLINVGLLLYFKYINFIIGNINTLFKMDYAIKELVLPLGISFFTFQQIAYLVSVYREELEGSGITDYLVYILYFPKLLMGPLMEPADFLMELNEPDRGKINWEHVAEGLKIFSFGLFKKALLADTFASAVAWGYANVDSSTAADWLLIMLFYTFEIYFDFSGYSDMATGVSRMLNITLPVNFDSPYMAGSIRDFWRRWHISLTKFLTKYIYIPLGGNRKGELFTYLNVMVVFLVSGIWHGANWTFILWGVLHGMLSVLERIMGRYKKKFIEPVKWFCTFGCVNLLWLLFRSDSVGQWKMLLKKIFFFKDTAISDGLLYVFHIPETVLFNSLPCIAKFSSNIHGWWMFVFLILSFGICLIPENNYKKMGEGGGNLLSACLAAAACVWSILCLGTESVFVYFNF